MKEENKEANRVVLDCSFLASNVLQDERTELELIPKTIYVPDMFYLEYTNVLFKSKRRNRITKEQVTEYLNVLNLMVIVVDNLTPQSFNTIIQLCHQYDLSSYDASYLELALRINADLFTYDNALKQAFLKATNI